MKVMLNCNMGDFFIENKEKCSDGKISFLVMAAQMLLWYFQSVFGSNYFVPEKFSLWVQRARLNIVGKVSEEYLFSKELVRDV